MSPTQTQVDIERDCGPLLRPKTSHWTSWSETVPHSCHTLCAPHKKLTNGASSLHLAGHMLSRAMFITFESWFEHSFHGFSRFITSRASPDVVSLNQHCT
jgi:hypothetical protein